MKKLYILTLMFVAGITVFAQDKSDIFKSSTSVTWLGLDFSQVKFIGTATQWKDAGDVTNTDMKNKYFPSWNDLFVTEKTKYNVADAVHRMEVQYATDVTDRMNEKITDGDFFTDDNMSYQLLTEDKISSLVKKYNFDRKKGIGLVFFVEGMSKNREQASMWATFVDMGSKKVLLTHRITGKAGGFGFRNYWAKAFFNGLKQLKSDYKGLSKT